MIKNFEIYQFSFNILGQDYRNEPTNCWKHCPPVNMARAKAVCQQLPLTVIRTVRVCRLHELEKMVQPGRQLRVAVVTRDPRAVALSRLSNHQVELPEVVTNIKRMCFEKYENILTMLRATMAEDHEWLRNDAYILRFEDMIHAPRQEAERLFEFAGINVIDEHHNAHFQKVIDEAHHERLDDWRRVLEFDDVKHIQEACENLMVFMGYRMYESEYEMKNPAKGSLLFDHEYSKVVEFKDRKRTIAAKKHKRKESYLLPGIKIS